MKNLHGTKTRMLAVLTSISAFSMVGCSKLEEPKPPAPSPAPMVQTAAIKLPVSINAVMVSLVDASMRPFWMAATKAPKNDKDWSELEYHAWQTMIAGTIIKLPGTGPADAAWVTQPEWIKFADQLTAEGQEALAAAQTKDASKFEAIGNKVVETCEACHSKFKPELPTGKILLRYP